MNDIIRARWIKELRNTTLKQAPVETEALCDENRQLVSVDPIGMFGNLYVANTQDATIWKNSEYSNEIFVNHRHPGLLKWAGITGEFGEDPDLVKAIQLHDATPQRTFTQIADALEGR